MAWWQSWCEFIQTVSAVALPFPAYSVFSHPSHLILAEVLGGGREGVDVLERQGSGDLRRCWAASFLSSQEVQSGLGGGSAIPWLLCRPTLDCFPQPQSSGW